MTEIIFSFDTEDFTSSIAADAIYEEAEILRSEGIKGGFCLVGLLAKQLINWGKTDVCKALKHHVIGNHSFGHTVHPTINEYTDKEDFDEAQKELLRQENESEALIKKAVGDEPIVFACPPGNQKSYVAMYSYADMGIPIYADTVCDTPDGRGVFYCNIYQIKYTYMLESSFAALDSDEKIAEILDSLAKNKRAVIYTHPHYALYKECWDSINYKKENLREFGNWIECKRHDEEATERFYIGLRRLIRAIKNDERFKITDYEEISKKLANEKERVILKSDISKLCDAINKEFYPVTSPVSLSISDMFLACRDFLMGEDKHVCGKVYGFLDEPFAISEEVTLSSKDIIDSANTINTERFLPTEIMVGGKKIGPADWLKAAMEVIKGNDIVTVKPGPQMPSLDELPSLRDCDFAKYRWMQSDDFVDKYLSKRLRLQAWTMRF